ncbi:response regulator [Devosia sp. LjRoot16]|uniref:response regulator n=1 Tax=Devosia sp. LjRoot16 TaxID=3342271 RepID=UPI003ECDE56A
MSGAGTVLIVDDSAMVRTKLSKAVEALGYAADAVGSGAEALKRLGGAAFDVVLLDIVMPEMDGFEVLKALKASTRTRDLPVIVISALDEEMSSVVKAIELGAEDFLPKDFEVALLRARLSTSVEKKRLRDNEKEYLREVTKLTRAASTLELGKFNPEKLGINEVAARGDGLGTLAKVFSTMAQSVYERERKLRQSIRTFRGALILIACGVLWGLVVPLAKLASEVEAHPVGLAILIDTLGAVLCIGISLKRGTLPKLSSLGRGDISFIVVFALLSAVLNQVLVYWMASQLPAFIVSIVIVLEGFIVFLFAALMRTEVASLKRFAGLGLGLVGIIVILLFGMPVNIAANWLWVGLALLIPVTYAAEDLFIAERRPARIDTIALFGLVQVVSVATLIPIAFVTNDFVPFEQLSGQTGIIVLLMAVASNAAMLLFMWLIKTTGAVFGSQTAYAGTAAGIGWSMLLLGEAVPLLTWGALALVFLGLLLVEPKQEAEAEPPVLDEPEDEGPVVVAVQSAAE